MSASASSPDLLEDLNQDEDAVLSRSASYQHLPNAGITQPVPPPLRRTFSDLATPTHAPSPSKEDVAAGKDILRRTSLRSKSRDLTTAAVSRLDVSSEELEADDAPKSDPKDAPIKYPETRAPEPVARPSKARSVSGRLVSLARKPWSSNPPSRSVSPSKSAKSRTVHAEDQSSTSPPSDSSTKTSDAASDSDALPPRKRTILKGQRPRRPMVAVVHGRGDSVDSAKSPSTHSLRPKNSLEKFSASLNVTTPVLPPISRTPSPLASNPEPPRKKDELWGVFRTLEADFQKFQSKSSALKANVIRSSLVPFLTRHQLHSCKNLRLEDLDRRVNILNKWWTGLLEMLNGRNNQSISGTDRPVYLEAVVGIMTRPEWRVAFPMSHPSESLPKSLQHTSSSMSDSSERSSGSDFLFESIHHNIRNIFIQNLLSQMAFVIERMSLRHAPASLVAFCGKACAYAFFFCPGVADILVRLWNIPASVYRRIAESSVDRSSTTRSFTQDLALSFPVALQSLAFHSHAALVRYLRQKPDVPLNTNQIPWQSPWVSRWCGRDTDLFFVFVKFVHILYADSMPRGIDKKQRILAPGLLPIHARLLVVLEDTLYKQSVPQVPDNIHNTAAVTFDDFIEGPDTAVSALPLGTANSHRSMAENRLIILLRDFLSESSVEPNRARLLYAESFCGIMKTTVQRTSLYDQGACFLLCDFMEEVIPIITRYSQSVEMVLFDWSFWLDVCRQMVQSHNSLTEVRVFSFLYCMWNTWVSSEERKEDLCLNFILHESWFYHYFNHWSPMVRSYFHRLVLWRIARFNEDPSPLDKTIYETLLNRLHRMWEYFIAYQVKASEESIAPLSSAACTPAPGRRFIIIRCDNQMPPANLFVSFDRVVPPAPPESALSKKKSNTSISSADSSSSEQPKKKWSILKAMFGVSSSSKSSDSQSSSSSDDLDTQIPDTALSTGKCLDGHPQSLQSGQGDICQPKPTHQAFSFKFSLEWSDRPHWPPRNRRLFPPSLPAATQLHLQRTPQPDVGKSEYDTASENPLAVAGDDTKNLESGEKTSTDEQSQTSTPVSAASPVKEPGPYQASKAALNDKAAGSKYVGRALAEWAVIVAELDSFFARRRDEGVPCDRMVETPTLGVESFRK